MTRRVVLEPAAQADIDGAEAWYEGEQPGVGARFLREVSQLLERISSNPLQFPSTQHGVRRALLRRFPYGIYFLPEAERIVVIAVLRLHRNFDIRRRLP